MLKRSLFTHQGNRSGLKLIVFKMLTFLFLIQTIWCYHSLESSRRDDFNEGHIIGFGWEIRKLWKPFCSLFLNCSPVLSLQVICILYGHHILPDLRVGDVRYGSEGVDVRLGARSLTFSLRSSLHNRHVRLSVHWIGTDFQVMLASTL